MTFVPNLNFFEFIPERDWFRWQMDRSYQPKTVLLGEVEAGRVYEIVITNFHGGIMTRYRPGDLVKISSLRNERLNIDIPQMLFHSRADDLIDITGFGHLTERIIWEGIEGAGVPYNDWTARKETRNSKPVLHLYIEPKDEFIAGEQAVASAIYDELIKLDGVYHYNIYDAYGDPETVLGFKPVEVSFLPRGTFIRYISERQAEGAALGHLKPPHINPSERVLSLLGVPVAGVGVGVEAVPATETERTIA
jgi:hypothetical protein